MSMHGKTRLLCFLAAAALYAGAAAACQGAVNSANLTYLALDSGASLETVEKIAFQEEEPVGCCFWGEEEMQTVSCPATGQSAAVTRVYLGGNAELLGAGQLFWQDGCLIDTQTARDLFGTEGCGGQQLSCNGQTLPVLGTVTALRPTLVMGAGREDVMNRCVLALPAENGKVLGEQFLMRFGLRGKVLDFFSLWALMRNCLLLAPAVLVYRLCGRRKALALVLVGLLLWRGTVIPPEMIPSRWSDFSFWGSWWESQTENFRCILFTPLGGRQLQILLNMVKSMGGSILAAFLASGVTRRRQDADTAH